MKSALFSFAIHASLFSLLLFSYEAPEEKITRKLLVQTVKLTPQKRVEEVAMATETAPAAPTASTPKAPAKKEVKKEKAKCIAPKKEEKKGPVLTDAQKNKIQNALKKPSGGTKGTPISKLSTIEGEESGYGALLTSALQSRLSLAVGGSVKVSLLLTREGKVKKVTILSSESSENRKKIESSLKEATLTPFGRYFPGEKEHEFVIVLSGE